MSVADKIRVMHVASGDLWAGAEVQLFTLATTQHSQKETDVRVILLNHGKLEQKLREAGIEVIVLDESILNGFQILLKLIRTANSSKPTVIHTHRLKENILGSLAAYLIRTPTLRTSHGAPEHHIAWYHAPKRVIQMMDRFCGRYIQNRIIAVSADLAIILGKTFPANKIEIIENGIDYQSLPDHQNNPADEANTDTTTLRIGIAGRLVPVKRIDLFIQTARQLLDDNPGLDVRFHIFGDGPLRRELESMNIRLRTNNRVNFEGHTDNITRALKNIDVLMMTSDHEGLPMILLEAMALKIPIISHATGGITELLDNGNCGILVKDHTAAGYALAIKQLSDTTGLSEKLTTNAYDRLTSEYSATQNASHYLSVYREITAKNID